MSTVELTDETFQQNLEEQDLAFVDIYASWCGPCKLFRPIFDKVAHSSSHAFYKIDGDKHPGCRSDIRISNLPFVAAFKKGHFIRGVATSTESGLREFIQEVESLK